MDVAAETDLWRYLTCPKRREIHSALDHFTEAIAFPFQEEKSGELCHSHVYTNTHTHADTLHTHAHLGVGQNIDRAISGSLHAIGESMRWCKISMYFLGCVIKNYVLIHFGFLFVWYRELPCDSHPNTQTHTHTHSCTHYYAWRDQIIDQPKREKTKNVSLKVMSI